LLIRKAINQKLTQRERRIHGELCVMRRRIVMSSVPITCFIRYFIQADHEAFQTLQNGSEVRFKMFTFGIQIK
jgi:hypothetical protein